MMLVPLATMVVAIAVVAKVGDVLVVVVILTRLVVVAVVDMATTMASFEVAPHFVVCGNYLY